MRILLLILIFATSCVKSRERSQDVMANEAEKQTKLMQEQVIELKRIADALEGDTTRWKSYIIKSKP